MPGPLVDHFMDLCTKEGDGWRVPVPFEVPADATGEIADYFSRASIPMPLRCFTEPVTAGAATEFRSLFLICTDVPADEDFLIGSSERAKKLGGEHREIEAPHDAPYLAPGVLTKELMDLTRLLGTA